MNEMFLLLHIRLLKIYTLHISIDASLCHCIMSCDAISPYLVSVIVVTKHGMKCVREQDEDIKHNENSKSINFCR